MTPNKRVTYSSNPNRAARAAHARGAREFKTYDTSYIRPKRSKTPFIIGAIVLIVVLVLLFNGVRSCCSPQPSLPQGQSATISVPDGSSTRAIGSLLEEAGLVGSAGDFVSEVEKEGVANKLKPGTYHFTGGTSVANIVNQIAEGPVTITLVVPEGKTAEQTAELVSGATDGAISSEDFMKCVNNASDYKSDFTFVAGSYNNTLEGFLFPKTYKLEYDDTADSVVRMMLEQYKQEVASLDYSYAKSKNLTEYDVLTLASVIEKEAAKDNRADVSSVFYNRLAEGMRLQSDATVAYVVGDDPTPDDLKRESPYNTYLNAGLPAGPICSPGVSSLEAACKPTETNYLYFYFAEDDKGVMQYYFSENYDDHLEAIGTPVDSSSSSDSQ